MGLKYFLQRVFPFAFVGVLLLQLNGRFQILWTQTGVAKPLEALCILRTLPTFFVQYGANFPLQPSQYWGATGLFLVHIHFTLEKWTLVLANMRGHSYLPYPMHGTLTLFSANCSRENQTWNAQMILCMFDPLSLNFLFNF